MNFEYQLLARLQQDCEYFLGFGDRKEKHLWALSVVGQIAKMKELYNLLIPLGEIEWINLEEILDFEKRMLDFS